MRKMLQNKKGFTLVELMIVIVIMGILVAVAIPIYGAVTKNAEKKSCLANQNIISTNLSQYQMTGNGGDMIGWATLVADFNGKTGSALPASYRGLFKDGVPTCPTAKAQYSIAITAPAADTDATGTIKVTCTDTTVGAKHV
ncbi:MAG: type II secretion system protein [Oscillospiraceae bacterium]